MRHDLTLPPELTIYTVAELHPRCVALAAAGATSSDESLTVDAAAVAEVDAAGVQLLLSLANTLALHGRRLRLAPASATLAAACAALGATAAVFGAEGAAT